MLRRFLHSRDSTFKRHTSLEEFYSGRDCQSVLNKLHVEELEGCSFRRHSYFNELTTPRKCSVYTHSKWTSFLLSEQCSVYRLTQSEWAPYDLGNALFTDSLKVNELLTIWAMPCLQTHSKWTNSLRSGQCPVYRLTQSERASYDQNNVLFTDSLKVNELLTIWPIPCLHSLEVNELRTTRKRPLKSYITKVCSTLYGYWLCNKQGTLWRKQSIHEVCFTPLTATRHW